MFVDKEILTTIFSKSYNKTRVSIIKIVALIAIKYKSVD